MIKKFILLKFYNQYDQEGGYFSGVFDSKEALIESVNHIGRVNNEDEWYLWVETEGFTGVIDTHDIEKLYNEIASVVKERN